MQESNPEKEKATNSQIMFLCLHAAGLTLIPTSIIGYRAAMNAGNPADIMLPTIITSFIGTIAAMVFVSIRQRINLLNAVVIGVVAVISIVIGALLYVIARLSSIEKFHFTNNLSNGVLLFIILAIVAYAFWKEKVFRTSGTNILIHSFMERRTDHHGHPHSSLHDCDACCAQHLPQFRVNGNCDERHLWGAKHFSCGSANHQCHSCCTHAGRSAPAAHAVSCLMQ